METNKVVFLTDELIHHYADENCIIDNHGDVYLKDDDKFSPYVGTVYDQTIFGSMFSSHCNCGTVRTYGMTCSNCGSTLLDERSAFMRWGRIDSPIYFLHDIRFNNFLKYIKGVFPKIERDYDKRLFGEGLTKKVFENLQFEYQKDDDRLIITDAIDDVAKCSYEGLFNIINTYKSSEISNYRSYINRSLIVAPPIMRPPRFEIVDGHKKLKHHRVTVLYQNIIYAINTFYKSVESESQSNIELALVRGCLRRFISTYANKLSNLLQGSKGNAARLMQSTRIPNSGRCTIIPGPDLKIDEVKIPRHLMYEACREEFVEYLASRLNISLVKAKGLYKNQATSVEVQDEFTKFVNGDATRKGKYVILNRNPSLHEYNLMACKVILTNDYTMSIPLGMCSPMNADFDGDTMSFYVINDSATDYVVERMSPKNMIYYKKSLDPMFVPNHEVMNGLIIATKIINNENILEFDTIDDALIARNKRQIRYQTIIKLADKDDKQTTLGRYILSELFGVDLDIALDGITNSITSKNIIPLISKLSDYEDRTERLQKIQEFALKVVTITGASAPKLSELYAPISEEFSKQIREVFDSTVMTESEKSLKARLIYTDYIKNELNSLDSDLVIKINESSRAKLEQVIAITRVQLNVGVNKEVTVSNSTIAGGMIPRDYERHAIENRGTQDIKVQSVPLSGNLTRQFVYLAQEYTFTEVVDENNTGIFVNAKDAIGRTSMDGTVITKVPSEPQVRVRSILGDSKNERVIRIDEISRLITHSDNDNLGISMMSSLTEGITQGALKLKHGGFLFNLDPNGYLRAPEDCTVSMSDSFIVLKGSSRSYKYPKPSNFVLNYSLDNSYKIGEVIGCSYHLFTPAYNLDSAIELTLARKITPPKKFAQNRVIKTASHALSDGVIKYIVNPKGKVVLTIGSIQYPINEESLYMYPEGTEVKKYQRISTSLLDMNFVFMHIKSIEESFYFFRSQFLELIPGINTELLEFLYKLIIQKNKSGDLYMKRVISTVLGESTFFTGLSFEAPKKTFEKVLLEGMELKNDTFANSQLQLILTNSLM